MADRLFFSARLKQATTASTKWNEEFVQVKKLNDDLELWLHDKWQQVMLHALGKPCGLLTS